MTLPGIVFAGAATSCLVFGVVSAIAQPTDPVAPVAVHVLDSAHSREPLPDGIIAWDQVSKAADAAYGQESIRVDFGFKNISTHPVTIFNVKPSCGCTTAVLPPVPWTLLPGSSGEIKLNVNLQGKSTRAGMLTKTIGVATDEGLKILTMQINVLPPPLVPERTEAQRAAGVAMATVDRQAVFKNDCASCHLPDIERKYGEHLFKALCAICHESPHRATMVPDLRNLNVPTDKEFWRTLTAEGRAGTLMPAFASSRGGPLDDLQVSSLAAYLNTIYPPSVPQSPK